MFIIYLLQMHKNDVPNHVLPKNCNLIKIYSLGHKKKNVDNTQVALKRMIRIILLSFKETANHSFRKKKHFE